MKEKFGAVLAAAGNSTRMGNRTKVLEPLAGRPALWSSLRVLCACGFIGEICVVCRPQDMSEIAELAAQAGKLAPNPKRITFAAGGASRQESVENGALALSEACKYLVIHDGARPFLTLPMLEAVCLDALEYGAASAAVQCKDTCKLADPLGFVESTPPRERLMAVQTPQAFERSLYEYALSRARATGKFYTDDCQLIEAAGGRVKLTAGDYNNFKLTTPEDLLFAKALAGEKERENMRIGSGYDVHRLAEGRKFILGGVNIPYEQGLLGHSDADVLAHAIADSLLGAAALGDIGKLFPDSDPKYQGADSLRLLEEVCGAVRAQGLEIGNIDATVIAQRPKLADYIGQMRENLARACGVQTEQVSVKATTEEGLGFTGRGEGIAATATCLLKSQR